jgi:hypothetical protein
MRAAAERRRILCLPGPAAQLQLHSLAGTGHGSGRSLAGYRAKPPSQAELASGTDVEMTHQWDRCRNEPPPTAPTGVRAYPAKSS